MMTLRELLLEFKRRPGMYIGRPSLIRMRSFIDGWIMGIDGWTSEKARDAAQLGLFDGFNEWMASKYAIRDSLGWQEIIFQAEIDDKSAFEAFWVHFEEFLAAKGEPPLGD